jgi:hypothetical protein
LANLDRPEIIDLFGFGAESVKLKLSNDFVNKWKSDQPRRKQHKQKDLQCPIAYQSGRRSSDPYA